MNEILKKPHTKEISMIIHNEEIFKTYNDVDELIDCQYYIHLYKNGEHIFTGGSLTWLVENNFDNQIKKALMDLNKYRITEFHELHFDYIIEKSE